MGDLGTSERPLRVAIVGSGPSGFYAADPLLKSEIITTVDGLFFFLVPWVIRHTVGLRRFWLASVDEGAGKLVSFAASFPAVAVRLVLVRNC